MLFVRPCLRGLIGLGLLLTAATAQAQSPAIGLHYGSDFSTTQYEDFGAWLGRKVMYRVTFLDKTSWSTIESCPLIATSKKWVQSYPGRVEVISTPMFANGDKSGFSSITSGKRDAAFRAIAAKIQSAGIADKVIIRLAWEANGDWYNWSYLKDPAGFKAAWRHIVFVMRKAAPKLRFEFNISCIANRNGGAKWTEGYPGDDVVDVISMDIYDHWNPWTTMLAGDGGLNEMREFAKKHNKVEAYSEWSCSTTSNGHGDNSGFIRAMHSWMNARPGKVLYHSYWNTQDGAKGLLFSLTSKILVPTAAAEYKRLFGAPTVSAATANSAPKISGIGDRKINVNGSTGAISFSISDAETSASNLTLIANTSNQLLIPPSRVSFGGSGGTRTVTVTPVSNKTGWSTVWVKVSDGHSSATTSFVVNVSGDALSFTNVGSNNVAGSHVENSGKIKMYARGYDIAGRADECYFGSNSLSGDAEMIVKLSSFSGPHSWGKAGLMFRNSNSADAAFVAVLATPGQGVLLQWRSRNGDHSTTSATLPRSAPRWLRLIRDGDAFHGFSSSNGENWEWIASITVDLADTARAGLVVSSHDSGGGATALFENFTID